VWQVTISTSADAEDAVGCLLERIFHKPPAVYWDEATNATRVTVFPGTLPASLPTVRARLRAALAELRKSGLDPGSAKITVKLLPRENWAESWKRHFKPLEVGDFLLIKPGWSRRQPRRGQKTVILDPGLSFGTGHHPTTLFCLQQLAQCRRPGEKQSFLDIGTGSGILAIAAAKLGYATVEAFDNDPAAVRVSRANVKKNHVQQRVRPQQKDLTALQKRNAKTYDVVCANLTWDLLISGAGTICARLKPGGKLIVAGILRRQFQAVRKKFQQFHLTLGVSEATTSWQSGRFVLMQRSD